MRKTLKAFKIGIIFPCKSSLEQPDNETRGTHIMEEQILTGTDLSDADRGHSRKFTNGGEMW